MYTSLYLPNARCSESLKLGFRKSLSLICSYTDSPVGISKIAIVGVSDNHTGKKDQEGLYCATKVVWQTPKGRETVLSLSG
jgi:hypothetical protein